MQQSGIVFVLIIYWTASPFSMTISGAKETSMVPVKLKKAVSTDRIFDGIPLKSLCNGIICNHFSKFCINIT